MSIGHEFSDTMDDPTALAPSPRDVLGHALARALLAKSYGLEPCGSAARALRAAGPAALQADPHLARMARALED